MYITSLTPLIAMRLRCVPLALIQRSGHDAALNPTEPADAIQLVSVVNSLEHVVTIGCG